MEALLDIHDLRKSYGSTEVIRGISLALARGECYGLLGPNGAGKTTTLRLCLGLTDPDAGTITLAGLPVPRAAREARLRLGVVPLGFRELALRFLASSGTCRTDRLPGAHDNAKHEHRRDAC